MGMPSGVNNLQLLSEAILLLSSLGWPFINGFGSLLIFWILNFPLVNPPRKQEPLGVGDVLQSSGECLATMEHLDILSRTVVLSLEGFYPSEDFGLCLEMF